MFFVVVIFISTVSAEYYVNLSAGTWDYRNPPCELATPDIIYSDSGQSIMLEPDVIDIAEGKPVSVGYTLTLAVFEYVGCMLQSDIPNTTKSLSTLADPGRCFSACQTAKIGICMNNCYCLPKRMADVKDNFLYCDQECKNQKNIVCGGRHISLGYVSIYQKVANTDRLEDDDKLCRIYDYGKSIFTWEKCDDDLQGLCQKKQADSGFSIAFEFRDTPWNKYPYYCYMLNKYPATENVARIQDRKDDDKQYWIGRVKNWAIARIKDINEDGFFSYYGYIKAESSEIRLDFDTKAHTRVLCNKETTTITTSSSSSSSSLSLTTSTTMTTSSAVLNSQMTSAGMVATTVTPSDQEGQERIPKGDSRSVPVAVIVVIPLILVTGAVVAVLFYSMRRRRASRKNPHHVTYSNDDITKQSRADGTAITNAGYHTGFVQTATETEDHDYSELNSDYQSAALKEETLASLSDDPYAIANANNSVPASLDEVDHMYHVLEKADANSAAPVVSAANYDIDVDIYDTTNVHNKQEANITDNMYNTFSEFAEETYNRTTDDQNSTLSAIQAQDCSYGCISNDGFIENEYNTAEGDFQYDSQEIPKDDTYSHAWIK